MSQHPIREAKDLLVHEGAVVVAAAVEQGGIILRSGRILGRTIQAFALDNIARLGAALAFYTTISVAPLLVLAIAMAGMVFGEGDARRQIIGEIEQLAGPQAGAAVASVHNPAATTGGLIATLIATGTLIFGTFGVFNHLQDALNAIWRVPPKPVESWWHFLKHRLLSLAAVIVTGFLLLVSLVASAMVSWLGVNTAHRLALPGFGQTAVNELIAFGIVTGLFAMIFRLVPETRVRMKHVWIGAAVTALLFTAGKVVLGYYLGRASLASAYGAAGSLVVLLLWSYYAAQIVFFGAEFTRVTALSNGGRDFTPFAQPAEHGRPG